MRIGVLSDVHDALFHLEDALRGLREREVGMLFFLGDFCSPIPSRTLSEYPGTVHCVFGNGDGDRFAISKVAREEGSALVLHGEWAELQVDGRRVALTHFPFYARALARSGDYDAVFNGHTHERHEERVGRTLWVNPGEILGWKGPPTWAVWETSDNSVSFHGLEGE
jgi:putative phosphoesterase